MSIRCCGRLLASSLAALALTFAVTGCSNQNNAGVVQALPEQGASKSSEMDPAQSLGDQSESPDASSSESPGASDDESPDTSQQAPGIRGKLLSAEDVPGFNEEFSWTVESTRMREGQQPFGTCHKFAMTSIGAAKVAVRSYAPASDSTGSTASHLVAEFADEMTAKRGFEVLKSWAGQCDEELGEYDRFETGSLQPVPVDAEGGFGHWYLLTYGPTQGDPDAGFFDAQGLTRVGNTISALQMRLVGQDYNYPAGEEPMVTAVQNAAVRLG